MNKRVKTRAEKASKLAAADRAELADDLLLSLAEPDPETDRLWAREAKSRLAAYKRSDLDAEDAEDVVDELRHRQR